MIDIFWYKKEPTISPNGIVNEYTNIYCNNKSYNYCQSDSCAEIISSDNYTKHTLYFSVPLTMKFNHSNNPLLYNRYTYHGPYEAYIKMLRAIFEGNNMMLLEETQRHFI